MKGKRLLSVLLALVMAVAMFVPTLAAAHENWQKTAAPAYRFFFSRWIANPLRNMLPDLGEGVGLDLTGDLFSNYFVDDFILELANAAGMFANAGGLSAFQTLPAIAPYLSAPTQADIAYMIAEGHITAGAPNNSWAHVTSLGINWGVECRATLLEYVPIIVRRFSAMAFRDDIRGRWQSHYAPAFRALGVPEEYIATQDELNTGWAAANFFADSTSDVMIRSVFNAVLYFTEAMENDLLGFLIANLPTIVQNQDAINQLALPSILAPIIPGIGGLNTRTDGYWLDADGNPRGGTVVGSALLEFLQVDLSNGGFMAFFEDTLANEFYNMGIEMPPIDWDLVYHAGDWERRIIPYVCECDECICDDCTQTDAHENCTAEVCVFCEECNCEGEDTYEYVFVTDERLMETLILRYLARVNANPANRPVLQGLIRDALPGFLGTIAAWAAPTVLGWIFDLSEVVCDCVLCECPPCECPAEDPCECDPCECDLPCVCPPPPTFLQSFLNGLGWGAVGAGGVAMLFVVGAFFVTIFR